jgi:hypothetical protein
MYTKFKLKSEYLIDCVIDNSICTWILGSKIFYCYPRCIIPDRLFIGAVEIIRKTQIICLIKIPEQFYFLQAAFPYKLKIDENIMYTSWDLRHMEEGTRK